ncbi:MAG: sigma-70 family RNA polymerase sigma factor [Armatimonadetes bacterium]|nr:sigma-70 family RNA polymerase sigma factor [Armatimonadota bacterium]MDE2206157.1 sigma-70 family RNA polymerase sigma factor [Armatimonadota bacterium]
MSHTPSAEQIEWDVLLQRARAGSDSAFEQVAHRIDRRVRRIAARTLNLGGSKAPAPALRDLIDDCASEIVIWALTRIRKDKPVNPWSAVFDNWVRHRALRASRRIEFVNAHLNSWMDDRCRQHDVDPAADRMALDAELVHDLAQSVPSVKWLLLRTEGWTLREIAQEAGLSQSAISRVIERARIVVADRLSEANSELRPVSRRPAAARREWRTAPTAPPVPRRVTREPARAHFDLPPVLRFSLRLQQPDSPAAAEFADRPGLCNTRAPR